MEYTEEKINAIGAVLENEAALEALRAAKDKEEIIRIFSEYGADIDEIAAQAAIDKISDIRDNGGELSDEELELVAGGWGVSTLCGMVAGGATTYALAHAGVAAVAFGGPIGVGILVGCIVVGVVATSRYQKGKLK